ncbi:MAG: hypothetical protein U0168_06515 [Nannocystaceae bacterium]
MSMLDAVTQHVRPITQPVIEAPRRAMPPPVPTVVEAPGPPPSRASRAGAAGRAAARGRRSSWPVYAALGVLAGAAVVFGIPQVRARVFGGGAPAAEQAAASPRDDAPLFADARAAIQSADPEALARADAALQAAIDGSGGDTTALRVLQAEVLATRALVHELWGAIDPALRTDARFWAQEDAVRAAARVSELDAATPGRARAEALLHAAQGRAGVTAPGDDPELAPLLAVAPLLRDDAAKLPEAACAALSALARPSIVAQLVLALGHARG